jgi:hypothetical protein
MILSGNLPRVAALARAAPRVLDVGGWWRPLNLATHVVDMMPYATRRQHDVLDPENQPRFSEATWFRLDACRPPWPFPDKFFDFSFCSHTLEDVRDPIAICGELVRVAKAGYIETPSREREIFGKARGFRLRVALGRMPEIGFAHHRWLVEIAGSHVRFLPKDLRLVRSPRHYITRGDLGRKLSESESGVALFWEGGFTFEEASIEADAELRRFRDAALARLRWARPG